uniref:Uncharacterized protein n=1 Tax=Oryza sativa subsp. japonica TaxID=39947 RepID=Q6K484_ORYSJ|nr:hypothetical protein [Oryza sativa Japonica Group]BAD26005.1 hypothetical protein [Oryza sativa Japonica Group]
MGQLGTMSSVPQATRLHQFSLKAAILPQGSGRSMFWGKVPPSISGPPGATRECSGAEQVLV